MNPGPSPDAQVDAEMRSGSLPAETLPSRAVAVAVQQPAHEMSLRHLVTADTQHAAGRIIAPGYSHTAVRFAGIRSRVNSCFVQERADHAGSGPYRADQARRARRVINDNAHANRCAPPGRNPGGGAQGQPD